jgi:uncharacterized protein YjbI with pentapeptide repeats
LTGANLGGANMDSAKLDGAILPDGTTFGTHDDLMKFGVIV